MINALAWLGFLGFGAAAIGGFFIDPFLGSSATFLCFLCLMATDD